MGRNQLNRKAFASFYDDFRYTESFSRPHT